MSFTWTEYLDLAYELVDIPPAHPAGEEAHQRTALTRAYYATHKTALNIARSKDRYVTPRTSGVHVHLIDHFANSSDPQRIEIASDLRSLLRYRREADYNDFIAPSLLMYNTTAGLQLATHLLAKLTQL